MKKGFLATAVPWANCITDVTIAPLGVCCPWQVSILETSFIFYSYFLFLPLNLANIPAIIRLIRGWRWMIPIGLAIFVIYLLTFQSTHPYNQTQPTYFLRNQLLIVVTQTPALYGAIFIPIAWSLLSLGVTRLRQKNYFLLYLFTVLSLLPFWLIEPRYCFVPLGLFLLFKEERSFLVEGLTIAFYVIVCILLVVPIHNELFFI
jgi:hypothetical protein